MSSICLALAGGGPWVTGGVVGTGGVVVGGEGGAVEGVDPVHVVPLRTNDDGTGLLPFQLPLKPNVAVPPVGTDPL
jgi:hypothetical protein